MEEAAKNNFRMDHLIGVWWSGGDQDAPWVGNEYGPGQVPIWTMRYGRQL